MDSEGSTFYTAFGGVAGTCAGTDICNTCTGAGLVPCNERAIGPNTVIRLEGKGKTGSTSRYGLLKADSDSGDVVAQGTVAMDGSGNFYIEVPWATVCGGMDNTACAADSSATFRFGVAEANSTEFISGEVTSIKFVVSNGTSRTSHTRCASGSGTSYDGFCSYRVSPGDGKLYVDGTGEDLQTPDTFPSTSSSGVVKWNRLLFFIVERSAGALATDLASVTNASDRADLPFSGDGSDIDPRVMDLENGVKYCLVMANEDEAGNIGNFADLAGDAGYTGDAAGLENTVCGTPSEVVGLLDDKKCFIATAAWGSAFEPHVQTLRHFRDRFLKTSRLGNQLIELYYEHGSRAARWIEKHEAARFVVRGALWPLVAFAWLSLQVGVILASLISILLMIFCIWSVRHLVVIPRRSI